MNYNQSSEMGKFKRATRGLVFLEDSVPAECSMACQVFDQGSFEEDLNHNYVGQLHAQEGDLASDLRSYYIDADEKHSQSVYQHQVQQESLFVNLMNHPDMNCKLFSEKAVSPKHLNLLQGQVDSYMFKFAYMMLVTGQTLPEHFDLEVLERDFVNPYNTHAKWKV